MDKVSLYLMKENVAENPFGTIIGKNSFFRAVSVLDNMQFSEDTDIEACIMGCPNIGSNNGLTVIVSVSLRKATGKKPLTIFVISINRCCSFKCLHPKRLIPPMTEE